ncbi:hypothetical protein V1634_23945 [Plantactinospora veratri]|uniref:Uncharacterized protein n=1 Tax=Plantactinospora veratri TaxID=1436122 RepID=A0ABU7SIU9_9ACTN
MSADSHPGWCDPGECTASFRGLHPDASPPTHASRWYDCNPQDDRQAVEITAQLVQYVDDPRPRPFIRFARTDFEDRQVFHITVEQGGALVEALADMLRRAGATVPAAGARPRVNSSP